ncbi:hypothetical protein ACW9KT_19655 [Hymenobacter sp. HD11105]
MNRQGETSGEGQVLSGQASPPHSRPGQPGNPTAADEAGRHLMPRLTRAEPVGGPRSAPADGTREGRPPSSMQPVSQLQGLRTVPAAPPQANALGTERANRPGRSAGLLGEPARLPGYGKEAAVSGAAGSVAGQPQPVIKVTIGRIDVRAVLQPAAARSQPKAEPRPLLSLDEYLQQRKARNSK